MRAWPRSTVASLFPLKNTKRTTRLCWRPSRFDGAGYRLDLESNREAAIDVAWHGNIRPVCRCLCTDAEPVGSSSASHGSRLRPYCEGRRTLRRAVVGRRDYESRGIGLRVKRIVFGDRTSRHYRTAELQGHVDVKERIEARTIKMQIRGIGRACALELVHGRWVHAKRTRLCNVACRRVGGD